jgi:hypothetical protein
MQQQQQQYHHYPDLPVDPQLTVGVHHWETPPHMLQQAQPMSLAAHLAAQHQAHGGGEAMHLDGDDDEGNDEDAKYDDGDVGSRLREELMQQAQMMGEAQARDDIY